MWKMLVFLTLVCGTSGQLPLEVPNIPRALASKEGEQCSSYGTCRSQPEETLEMEVKNDDDTWIESLEYMKCSIASMDATHSVIVDKLATLEKLISCHDMGAR
jgi:hypothetical protein